MSKKQSKHDRKLATTKTLTAQLERIIDARSGEGANEHDAIDCVLQSIDWSLFDAPTAKRLLAPVIAAWVDRVEEQDLGDLKHNLHFEIGLVHGRRSRAHLGRGHRDVHQARGVRHVRAGCGSGVQDLARDHRGVERDDPQFERVEARGGGSMSRADTRTIEKLIALLHYELAPETGGCSSSEQLDSLFDFVRDVRNESCPDEPMRAELDRHNAADVRIAEYLLRGLIAAGHLEDAERFVEGLASLRRECEAKFKVQRSIPFSEQEQEKLAAAWDASYAASRAREKECS